MGRLQIKQDIYEVSDGVIVYVEQLQAELEAQQEQNRVLKIHKRLFGEEIDDQAAEIGRWEQIACSSCRNDYDESLKGKK